MNQVPQYSTPIIQFGTSKFLQAHADLMFHEAGLENAVTVVASSGGKAGESRLRGFGKQDGIPILIQGLQNGEEINTSVQVKSIARGLSCASDWAAIVELVVTEARYILSNTTESGFDVPPDFVLDFTTCATTPSPSFPGKLLALLHARFQARQTGLTMLPTELVPRNGDVLRRIIIDLARRSGAEADFLSWIEQECLFVNSLVDRIVPTELDPVGAIAEPYSLWVVEDQPGLEMPCTHPSIQVVDNLETILRLKLHILNLGHTLLGDFHLNAERDKDESVFDMLSDPEIKSRLEHVYESEVLPCFRCRGLGDEAEAYIKTTMDRFLNPFLDHKMSFVVLNQAVKIERRIGDFLTWAVGDDQAAKAPILSAVVQSYR